VAAPATQPAPPAPPVPVPAPVPVPVPAVSETVAITLQGLPQGARVLLDDGAVEGAVLRAPRSAESHRLRVEASGHEPYEASVTFDQDRELTVAMVATAPEAAVTPPVASAGAESPGSAGSEPQSSPDRPTRRPGRTDGDRPAQDPSSQPRRPGGRRGVPQFDTAFE
jgi:hypothetical protein